MMKADMHIHSTVSDGSMSMEEIVHAAEEKGLDAVVFTEHDTLSHLNKLPHSDKLIVSGGIEISAFDYNNNFRVHVLGYNIKKPEVVEKAVHETLESRHKNSLRQIEKLNELGFEINIENVPKADGKYIYKQHIMDYLVKRKKVQEMFGDFYYKTFKNGGICEFDINYISPETAVKAIKDAGGLAVIAHCGQQQNFSVIPELVSLGLDGLELNHHSHSEKDVEIIKQYAEKYSLFLTGGSDCHGRYEPNSPNVGDFMAEQSGYDAIISNM